MRQSERNWELVFLKKLKDENITVVWVILREK